MLRHMHIHPGNANARLASKWREIDFLKSYLKGLQLNSQHQGKLDKLLKLIRDNERDLRLMTAPRRIGNIHNTTAAKYIELLMTINAVYIDRGN